MTERCTLSDSSITCMTEMPSIKYSWAAIFPVTEDFCKLQQSQVSYKEKDEKTKSKTDKNPKYKSIK